MPLDDVTTSWRELGKLKLGIEEHDRPASLDVWRLVSQHHDLIEAAAGVYGGTVTPAAAGVWQLITETSELAVRLPPQDVAAGQWWELWTAGGLQRRCSGSALVELDDAEPAGYRKVAPCQCDEENGPRRCKPTTVLRVLLPDLPDVGVWRLTTRSLFAARELPGAAEVLYRLAGDFPSAVLSIEHRTIKSPGQPRNRFPVPVLRSADTLSELLELNTAEVHTFAGDTGVRVAIDPPSDPPAKPRGPQEAPNTDSGPPGPEPPISGPWLELASFLAEHGPGNVSVSNTAATVAELVELERLMLAAGLWRPTSDGELPLDASARRIIGDAAELWRDNQLATAKLRTFAIRALGAAHMALDESPLGRRARHQLETGGGAS